MRTFTRGRLVPRQPRAIKRTTRTELRGESIFIAKYIHWNTDITHTALRIRIFVMANELIGGGDDVNN